MGSYWVGAVLGVALLTLTAGCSETHAGAPVAAAEGTSTPRPTGTSTPRPTTAPQPPATTVSRPRAIDLKGTDPCRILAGLPAEFDLAGRNLLAGESLGFPGDIECVVVNPDKSFTLALTPVTTYDAERFAATGRGEIARTTIAGFPAFTQNLGAANPACFAGVSVADGQMFYLQYRYNKPAGAPPVAELCGNAGKAMTAAMAVLTAS